MEDIKPISPRDFESADGLEEWRILGDGASIHFPTGSLAAGARLVQAIAGIPEVDGHPPAIDVRADGVTVRLVTWAEGHGGMTERDVDVAQQVTTVARDLGLAADPSAVQSLLIIPGAPSVAEITPFWRAVLGYEPRPDSPDEDLVDPHDRGTPFWFEAMDQPRADGYGSIHIGVWVPREQAEARIQAALAAGGRMVRDEFAPSWWTLADPAGNEADIATVAGRG